jgi:hypothetical protein
LRVDVGEGGVRGSEIDTDVHATPAFMLQRRVRER